MKTVVVNANDAGQRLDKLLTKTFRNLPPSLMYKGIRTKNIKLNGKRCEISTRVCAGDVISVYLKDDVLDETPAAPDFMTAGRELSVVYEDDNLLLLNKPAGLLVHPDENEYRDTLIFRVQRYLFEKGEYVPADENSFAPALVNRIDRNTSGIVIAAKNAETLRVLNEKIRDHEIEKSYLCVALGRPKPPEGRIEGFLLKDEAKKQVSFYRRPVPGGKSAVTLYRTLESRNRLSLVECRLLTGRTHQIRVSLAEIGCPLLGDGKYGRGDVNRKYGETRQALYSYKLRFAFPTDAGMLNYLRGKEFTVEDVPFREKYFPQED